jgi:hypothetical protein
MSEISGGVLSYRQMGDVGPLFENMTEGLCICVSWVTCSRYGMDGTSVERDVDVVDAVTQGDHACRGGPYASKDETSDCTCEGWMV